MRRPQLEDEPTKLKRAKTLLPFVENNGCTYIKIGQAASVREDIIDSTYAKELSQLQDRVPPFDSTLAKSILTSEIGSISSRFTKISDAPVASASIGQVYKATTVDGKEVAVKVRRLQLFFTVDSRKLTTFCSSRHFDPRRYSAQMLLMSSLSTST